MRRVACTLFLAFLVVGVDAHGASLINENAIGTTAGEHGVGSGSASYSIPLVVPPGRAGMQPSLSLNYSSSGGNGLLGVGWSLGGMYSITRCSAAGWPRICATRHPTRSLLGSVANIVLADNPILE